MKNFKRVISAVIALALSASTLVAVSASKFSDVDNTNNYAEAIEVLTALGIVHGYEEDGTVTFKPDGDITRAEAATMIVGALNMTKEAQAAAGTSKFTDVNEKASWASGYVNVGVAQGFINGMDDVTFAPQENVTYAQMCVMLTLITGYGDYAAAYGGYPTGYTTMAATAGINKGVALSADAKLKRGQVAQMLYNALTAPLLGVSAYKLDGNEYAMQDGTTLAFKTLLADKFEGYEVDIKIMGVPKSSSSLDKGEALINLTKDAYLDKVKSGDKTLVSVTANPFGPSVFDEAGVEDSLYMSGKGIVYKDANDKWHLVYFKAGETDKVVADSADYKDKNDNGKDVDNDKKITFGSKAYSVNTAATSGIYVNGTRYGVISEANAETVLSLAQGEVKLIDDNQTTGNDGYDKIMATVYEVARVASVSRTDDVTTIQLKNFRAGLYTTDYITGIELSDEDIEDGDIALTVKNAAGEDIALSSIKKDDVIAYAVPYSSTNKGTITPTVIDILVTDEKVSGVANRQDNTEKTYTIGDTEYKETKWGASSIDIGSSYTVILDPFGRIFDVDVESTSARYGIAEEWNSSDGLKVIRSDGSYKWYELSLPATGVDITNGYAVADGNTDGKIEMAEFNTHIAANMGNIDKRVIRYTVKNSSGKITSIETVNPAGNYSATAAVYKEKTGKLGSNTIIDGTAVLNVQDYLAGVTAGSASTSDYKKFALSSFVDKDEYKGYVYEEEKTAAFVILTEIGKDITSDSRFAVIRKAYSKSQTADGDSCLSINVLYEGKEQDLLFEDNTANRALNPGDAIFFKTDAEGLVSDIEYAFTMPATVNEANLKTAFGGTPFTYATPVVFGSFKAENKWDFTIDKANDAAADYQLVYGIVTDVTSKGVELTDVSALTNTAITGSTPTLDINGDATPEYNLDTNGDGTPDAYDLNGDGVADASYVTLNLTATGNKTEFFSFDNEYVAYRYATNNNTGSNAYKGISATEPIASTIDAYEVHALNSIFSESKTEIFNLSTMDGKGLKHLTYALALIIDGDIVEIYTITQ